MPLPLILTGVALFLAIGVFAVARGRSPDATRAVYLASATLSAVLLVSALGYLLLAGVARTVSLPVGLPWIGAHFRLDALAAFFLAVINLGGAAASLYGLGHGRHEQAALDSARRR